MLRANSAAAPGELFDAYGEQLIAYCWQLLRSEDATLIAVRDTMIVAQAHADRLRDPGLLGPWLLALARTECGRRRTPASGKAGKARNPVAAEVSGNERPPAAAWMRDEILTTIADPGQARYRALVVARAPRLGADGFPSARGGLMSQRSRKHGRRVRGGLLTAGVAAAAAMILVAAGVSLRGGEWPAAPAASAPPEPTAAGGGPILENTSAPQISHVTPAGLARQPADPPTFSPSATGEDHQTLYDVDSRTGTPGQASAAGPGGAPPAPPGLPPLMAPPGQAPATSPAESPSATPWQQPASDSPSPATGSPATGSPASPQPQPTMQDASSSQGAMGDGGAGGPGPGPTATFDSGGGQAQPGPGDKQGTWRGHGHNWRGRRLSP